VAVIWYNFIDGINIKPRLCYWGR